MKFYVSVAALFAILAVSPVAFGQEKGVDSQTKTGRDAGINRTEAVNGGKQDTGTAGSGINFGKEKGHATPLIPNPYRLTARRDVILKAVADTMRDRKLVLDDAASRLNEGIVVSQPYTFIKGTVVAASELGRYARTDLAGKRDWGRGRYTITVEVQAIDGNSSNVSVNAKIEGQENRISGAEWTTLESTGAVEQEFLGALIESITGAAPGARTPQ
jgi:hypothetical protein